MSLGEQTLEQRLRRYALRYLDRHNREEWPTVRQAAKALRVRQEEIELAADVWPLMLTSYFTAPPTPLAEYYVEVCE